MSSHIGKAIKNASELIASLAEELHFVENQRDRLAEALERIDYCLSNAEDIIHGAGSDYVSVARGIITKSLSSTEGEGHDTD